MKVCVEILRGPTKQMVVESRVGLHGACMLCQGFGCSWTTNVHKIIAQNLSQTSPTKVLLSILLGSRLGFTNGFRVWVSLGAADLR